MKRSIQSAFLLFLGVVLAIAAVAAAVEPNGAGRDYTGSQWDVSGPGGGYGVQTAPQTGGYMMQGAPLSGSGYVQGVQQPGGYGVPGAMQPGGYGMTAPGGYGAPQVPGAIQSQQDTEQEQGLRLMDEGKEVEQGPKLLLKAEPGDGMVSLTWTVTGVRRKAEDIPPRFVVLYGTEPEKYLKAVPVGDATSFRVRELKNNQIYYFRVQGLPGLGQRQLKALISEEQKATPIPVEELGSSLERAFARKSPTLLDKIEPTPVDRTLKQFGYDFFRNSIANLPSVDNLPVGSDYVIGPGDKLRIDVWGSLQARYDVPVDRNGEVTIPRVGAVKVWGLSYGQARQAIDKAFSRYYRGYELNVTLGSLRTIQVYVVGEVEVPGTYNVSSLATVINALAAAGGPSKNGSLRSIRISRGGKAVQEIDLYDMFLSGDRSRDIRLENGDTAFVPVIGPVVAVAGEVKRPGIYEIKGKTTLPGLLVMAGGITAAGDTGRIQVERIEGNSTRVVADYVTDGKSPDTELAKVEVRDHDMVNVFPVREAMREVVTLAGNVARPGAYQFRKGMRVKDLVPDASVLLPESYLESAEITRLSPTDYRREVMTVNLREALKGNPADNVELQEQDTIKIFSRDEMVERPRVSINGQVVNPGIYDYFPRMTVRDLVTAAGSPKRNAYLESAELTRVAVGGNSAKASRLEINLGKALAGDPANNLVLEPEDALIVRGIENWLEATDRFVTLRGEVKFPGTYSIAKGERLSSVIARAGGFTDKAYLKGAKFKRKSVRDEQQKRMDEVITRTEQEILRKQGELAAVAASKEELEATRTALEGLQKSLAKLRESRAEGRVVIRLAQLDSFRKSPYDLELMGGDILEVPQVSSVVNVMGQVYNPTSFVHLPGEDVAHYLKDAGGATRDGEEDDMYIISADGSVLSRHQTSFGINWSDSQRRWTFGGFLATPLDPGDTLVVPQKLERIAWMREIKDMTTILSQVALTAGVVVAAGL
ncbi:SLBB domain-containing protein [Geobacter hydrogenophilus]|uniref:Sugar ABC transporter substrate-binding protein n=1 Tax=Geobacter hydrogenophilus TaxID=40983 RepID=A0A9W6L9M6_9BACT|nr:SLBB domain-containing protein [Geobacter hydrogenophilus]MBT0895160.1 SLBB domain-containing protein [Geobacter hydrogenophilus]GLI36658.1 sugar ABC transporter substrate-binding protein [Geobacter hydrogenophilus]